MAGPSEIGPIGARFAALAQQGRCALMPFLMAGDPDLDTTAACLLALQDQGAGRGVVGGAHHSC